jgi:UDP-2,4-diacetamido-2,4,6-trideoxy-beta-L-altropyranose hydrolase
MNVVFRADASDLIGHGHVRRCLTLAKKLSASGATIEFVSREYPGNLCDFVEESGFPVRRLPAPASGTLSLHEDADLTRATMSKRDSPTDWLVVDHYDLDHLWEATLRQCARRIMVIDDLANREHDCDLLLDQNLVAGLGQRYTGKVPGGSGLLLGPTYALLEAAYTELHDRARPRSGPVRRILISFGGADADNLCARSLSAFTSLNRSGIEVDIAIGDSSPHLAALRKLAAPHRNVRVHAGTTSLALLLSEADLAIGAAGTTTWERLCLGVPSLVVTVAPNQEPAAAELNRLGLIRLLGDKSHASESSIASALEKLFQTGLDEGWSKSCLAAVDGRGADRVSAALGVSAETALKVRLATLDDEALLLEWANDPATRSNAFSPGTITPATHAVWFRQRLGNRAGCRLYIVETVDGIPIGMVRFDRSGNEWEVHYSIAQSLRGRGLGRAALAAALADLAAEMRDATVFGQVKESNHASRKVFESLAFTEISRSRDGVVVYRGPAGSERTPDATVKRHADRQ